MFSQRCVVLESMRMSYLSDTMRNHHANKRISLSVRSIFSQFSHPGSRWRPTAWAFLNALPVSFQASLMRPLSAKYDANNAAAIQLKETPWTTPCVGAAAYAAEDSMHSSTSRRASMDFQKNMRAFSPRTLRGASARTAYSRASQ